MFENTVVKIGQRFNQLTLRERILLLLAIVVVFHAIWEYSVLNPLEAKYKMVELRLEQLQKQNRTLDKQLQHYANQDIPTALQIKNTATTSSDDPLKQYGKWSVTATEMLTLLKQILPKQLDMMEFKKWASVPLPDTDGVYKQSISLRVQGTKKQILQYLQKLETLPLYWEDVQITIQKQYIQVKLQIYTLNQEKV